MLSSYEKPFSNAPKTSNRVMQYLNAETENEQIKNVINLSN